MATKKKGHPESATDNSYKIGIDISHYQNDAGAIDWNALVNPPVPNAPITFMYIKLSEGKTNQDPYGPANAGSASAANIPLGFYHLAHPGNNTAADEATNFFNQVKATGVAPTLSCPYMLDLEFNEVPLTTDQYLQWINDFIASFLGNFAGPALPNIGIYGSPSNLNSWLPATHNLGGYPLWVAYYPPAPTTDMVPTLPTGWTDWLIWQYTKTGAITGITGDADLDWSKTDLKMGTSPKPTSTVEKIKAMTAGFIKMMKLGAKDLTYINEDFITRMLAARPVTARALRDEEKLLSKEVLQAGAKIQLHSGQWSGFIHRVAYRGDGTMTYYVNPKFATAPQYSVNVSHIDSLNDVGSNIYYLVCNIDDSLKLRVDGDTRYIFHVAVPTQGGPSFISNTKSYQLSDPNGISTLRTGFIQAVLAQQQVDVTTGYNVGTGNEPDSGYPIYQDCENERLGETGSSTLVSY